MHILNKRHGGQATWPIGSMYVGRPTRWGNPFVLLVDTPEERASVLVAFRTYAERRLKDEPDWLDGLRGAPALICWCYPKDCHATVLRDLIPPA